MAAVVHCHRPPAGANGCTFAQCLSSSKYQPSRILYSPYLIHVDLSLFTTAKLHMHSLRYFNRCLNHIIQSRQRVLLPASNKSTINFTNNIVEEGAVVYLVNWSEGSERIL